MWLTVEGDACATFADYIKSGGIRLQHGRYTLWIVLTLNKCVPSCFCAYARKFYKIADYRSQFETTGYIQESISLCSIPTKCERIGGVFSELRDTFSTLVLSAQQYLNTQLPQWRQLWVGCLFYRHLTAAIYTAFSSRADPANSSLNTFNQRKKDF